MSIVSSTHQVGHPQADGRAYVEEVHTTDLGEVIRVEYGPVVSTTDYQAVADARAVQIAEHLAREEFLAVLGGA